MAGAYGEDDYQPQTYQDDLSTDDSASDPAMNDLTENAADEIGIPEQELSDELKKYTGGEEPTSDSDVDGDELEDRGSLIEDEDDEDGTLPANER